MWFRIVWERGGEPMLGWLRRKRSDDSGETGWSADPAPTPDERRDELLSAYLDDDLTAAERAELDARLKTDAALRDAFEGMQTVRDTLATLEVVRAPRSFAITAPAPAARRFRPFDLVARGGAMVAAVAFVVVLAGDLSGSGGTPVVQESNVSTTESGAALGQVAEGFSAATADSVADQTESAPGGNDSAGAAPPPDAADEVADATPGAALLDPDASIEPTAATAARSATEEPSGAGATEDSVPSDGADAVADDGTVSASGQTAPPLAPNTGGAVDPSTDATPNAPLDEAGAPSADPADPPQDLPAAAPADVDTTRVDEDDGAGTLAAESALGTQSGETSAVTASAEAANALPEDGREVSSLAIGLGGAAALLAAASGLLWWRRREGTVGPV